MSGDSSTILGPGAASKGEQQGQLTRDAKWIFDPAGSTTESCRENKMPIVCLDSSLGKPLEQISRHPYLSYNSRLIGDAVRRLPCRAKNPRPLSLASFAAEKSRIDDIVDCSLWPELMSSGRELNSRRRSASF
jgi:hypothetical protein